MKPAPLHHVWQYTDVDRAFWQEHLEAWMPAEIFDAHTHVNEPKFCIETLTEEKQRQHWFNEVNEPIGAVEAQRCHGLVFPGRKVSCLAFGLPFLEYDIEASNASLQKECVRHGWHRLAVVRPQWSARQVAAELDAPNTLGVKVYYALIGNDPATRDKYLESSIFDFLPHHQLEVLNDRRAWVTLHVPKVGRLSHPDNIAEIRQIRRQYPNIVLVIAHLGRSYTLPHAQQSLPQFAEDDGLYFDVSAVFDPVVLYFALKTLGPSRLLYGTDSPIFYMRGRQQWQGTSYVNHTNYPFYFNRDRESPDVEAAYTLYLYEALRAIKQACETARLERAEVEAIFHGNARRLIDAIPKNTWKVDP